MPLKILRAFGRTPGLLMLLALGAFSPLVRAQQYSVTEIPPAVGETAAPIGTAINASGTVVGVIGATTPWAAPGIDPELSPEPSAGLGSSTFQYSSGTTLNLGSPPQTGDCGSLAPSIGSAINASGQITGAACANSETPTAYFYQPGANGQIGTFTLIPEPADILESWGNGINASGQVVGTAWSPSGECFNGIFAAFLYDRSTGLTTDLASVFGCDSVGVAINDSGQIVIAALDASLNWHGYVYSGGTATDVGNLLCSAEQGIGTSQTSPLAINASGQVTGVSDRECGYGPDAFLYDPPGTSSSTGSTMRDIGNLGGVSGSQGNAINSTGQVVGLSYTTGDAALHAFFYANGSMVDLNSKISAADAARYTLVDAVAINDSGEIVVEAIKITTGQPVTVLLTPVDTVPNVVGDTRAAATSALTAAGFVLGAVTTQASASVSPGLVITQNPGAGTSLETGSAVNLTVSSGVSVPNVVGVPLTTASNELASAGLKTGSITQQYSSTAPQGTVIAENPAAGASVAGDSAVNLVISEGSAPLLTEVPNLIGDTQVAAEAALTGSNLALGTVGQQASAAIPSGEVLSQSPVAGDSVTVGSAVSVILSSGPPRMSIGLAGAPQFTYNGSGWVVSIDLQNNGNVAIDEINARSLSLNGTPLPSSHLGEATGELQPGGSQAIQVAFPPTMTVKSGVLKVSGTYTGTLSGNWNISARVSVPPAP